MFKLLQIESDIEMATDFSVLMRCHILLTSQVGRTVQLLNKELNYL